MSASGRVSRAEHAPPQCCASCERRDKSSGIAWLIRAQRGYVVVAAVIFVFAVAFLWAAATVLMAPAVAP